MKSLIRNLTLAALLVSPALARSSGHPPSHPSASRCTSCTRDSKGKIARNPKTKYDFQRAHPCPSTGKATGACPGYVKDHIVPLKRGGADSPDNMQWQTKADAKAKDRIE